MARFQHIGTVATGPATHVAGITAMLHLDAPGGGRLVTSTGIQGGLTVRDTGAAGLGVLETLSFAPTGGFSRGGGLVHADLGGRAALIRLDPAGGATYHWSEGGTPALLDGGLRMSLGGERLGALATAALPGGATAIYTASADSPGIAVWLRDAAGGIDRVATLRPGTAMQGLDIQDLEVITHGAHQMLLAVSARDATLTAWRVGAGGRAIETDTLTASEGFAVAAPSLIETVKMGARDFVLVGSPGTGSISVVLLRDGALIPIDQVNDDLSTRFQGISVLETVTLGDRVFVVAGGADDGLSLMTLLPTGRLLHLDTIADGLGTVLADPSALTLSASGGRIRVHVASEDEAGISVFEIDPGPLAATRYAPARDSQIEGSAAGDLLIGHSGDDRLFGRAGDDILVDGAGQDAMWGGPGADTFVFQRDGALDRVMDFEVGVDRIDISGMARVYRGADMAVRQIPGGIEYRWGDEILQVFSATGRAITPAQIPDADLIDLWHVAPLRFVEQGRDILGTPLDDLLTGRDGNDRMFGDSGRDHLAGGGGGDWITGEAVDARFDAAAGQVYRLYGATLDRAPDMAGHMVWTQRLLEGASVARVAEGFVDSAEFERRFDADTTADFVTLLYNNVLGRAPDAAGFAGWLRAMDVDGMSRAQATVGFSESPEYSAQTAAAALAYSRAGHQAEWGDEVYRLYGATLDRAPDAAGFLIWTGRLADGADFDTVANGFVASAEFQRRFDADGTAEFVTLLSRNVLGREPNAEGLAAWVRAIDQGGVTRSEAAMGFAQSAEYAARTATAYRDYMARMGEGDRIEGGPGSNTLFGGIGPDCFVFEQGDAGQNRIAGFEAWDDLALLDFGYASGAEARAHMTQTGRDVLFADQGTTILFEDTRLAEIGADQFVL